MVMPFDESKHKRDGGKFTSTGGGQKQGPQPKGTPKTERKISEKKTQLEKDEKTNKILSKMSEKQGGTAKFNAKNQKEFKNLAESAHKDRLLDSTISKMKKSNDVKKETSKKEKDAKLQGVIDSLKKDKNKPKSFIRRNIANI